jgi:hypothetical protein
MSILQCLRYVKLLTSTRLLIPTSMVSINQYVNITTPQVCQIVNTRLLTPTSMVSINQYINTTTPHVCQIVNIYQITDTHVYGFDKSACQYYNASGSETIDVGVSNLVDVNNLTYLRRCNIDILIYRNHRRGSQ